MSYRTNVNSADEPDTGAIWSLTDLFMMLMICFMGQLTVQTHKAQDEVVQSGNLKLLIGQRSGRPLLKDSKLPRAQWSRAGSRCAVHLVDPSSSKTRVFRVPCEPENVLGSRPGPSQDMDKLRRHASKLAGGEGLRPSVLVACTTAGAHARKLADQDCSNLRNTLLGANFNLLILSRDMP